MDSGQVKSCVMNARTHAMRRIHFMDPCQTFTHTQTHTRQVLGIVDSAGAWTEGASKAATAAFSVYATMRFFTFLRAVYIFRPYWVVAISRYRSRVISEFFDNVCVDDVGVEGSASAVRLDLISQAGEGRKRVLHVQRGSDGSHSHGVVVVANGG